MKTPRSLNGRDLADHLIRHWDYREQDQSGSHIILRTETPSGQTLPFPLTSRFVPAPSQQSCE